MHETQPKWRVMALAAIVSSMVLASCDAGTTTTPTQVQSTATTQVTEPVATTQQTGQATATTTGSGTSNAGQLSGTIRFQIFGDPAEAAAYQSVVDGFKEVQPNVTVQFEAVPNQGDHMTKLSTSFASGNPPDVWTLNYRRYGQFAAEGVIEPAGPLLAESEVLSEDMYYEEAMNAFRYQGELMCIPQNVSNLVVYYNKDMFAKAGMPFPANDWTWADFVNTAQRLTSTDAAGQKVHGVGIEPQLIRVAPFIWSNGGDIVDNHEKPTRLTLQEPLAREAIQAFMDLQLQFKVVPNEAEEKAEDIESRFINGRLGMIFSSRVSTPTFRESITTFDWDVAPLPRLKEKASILHSDAYCISKASPNKDLAWAFVEYAQSDDGQTRAAQLGRTVPSRKTIANSPAFLDPSKKPASNQVFLDAIPTMRLVPIISTWPKVENTVNEELERAFYAIVPLDTALQAATDQTNQLFADADK
ncbi:MAG TPA: sugar ABC transporter substrate-binding protein [Chloroflexia bacterium]